MNIDILGISELKWTGMGGLTQMTIVSSTVGKNPLEKMEYPYIIASNEATGELAVMFPEFEQLYQINSDIVGWISIADTRIDYPVVQRKDTTDYYLNRDFYGKYTARGCLYAAEACDVFAPSDNVIIYGHMMNDGSMFAGLSKYTSKAYWKDHQFIQFDTLRNRNTYQIVCVFKTTATAGKGFAYHRFINAQNDEDWETFWQNCQDNAFYDTGLALSPGDQIITLSTCEYTLTNGRLVIVAKLVD